MKPTRLLLTAAILVAAVAVSPVLGQAPAKGSVSDQIDAIFGGVNGQDQPGAVVVVLRDGQVLHSRAYGLANIELAVPNTTRTKFRLASVTKTFAFLAVLQLVEQGRLRLDDGRQGAYGYGFMLNPFRGLRELAHGGDISGFNTYVAAYPEERLAVIVLSNIGMQSAAVIPTAADIVHRVVAIVAAERLGPEWPPVVAVPSEVLDRYVGRHRVEAPPMITAAMGETFEFSREGGRLFAAGKQGRAEVFAESTATFYVKGAPIKFTFVAGGGDGPTSAVVTLASVREYRLVRQQ